MTDYIDSGTVGLVFRPWAFFLLDDFNRADNTSLGSNWTSMNAGLTGGAVNNPRISSNHFASVATNIWSSAFWNVYKVGPDLEAYATLVNVVDYCCIHARVSDDGESGYFVRPHPPGNQIYIFRSDNGFTTSLTYGSRVWTAGDQVKIQIRGSTIRAYARTPPGDWVLCCTAGDNTYPNAGYVGLSTYNIPLDDLQAGLYDIPAEYLDPNTASLTLTPSTSIEEITHVDAAIAFLDLQPTTTAETLCHFRVVLDGYEYGKWVSASANNKYAVASNRWVGVASEIPVPDPC